MKPVSIITTTLFAGAILGASGMHVVRQTIIPETTSSKTEEPSAIQEEIIKTNTIIARVATNYNNTATASAENTELQAELDELKEMLAERDAKIAEWEKIKKESERRRKERTANWHERTEKLKKEDPKRYEEIQKHRKSFREKMHSSVKDKSTFFSDIDTSGMTDEEKEIHQELLKRITETNELISSLPEGKMPDRETIAKFRENFSGIHELYETERNYVLKQVGEGLGYDKKEAEDFSAYINEVYELTSPSFPRGMRGGRSRRQ